MSRLDPLNKSLAEKQPSDPDRQCTRGFFAAAEARPGHEKAITPKVIPAKPRGNGSHQVSTSVPIRAEAMGGKRSPDSTWVLDIGLLLTFRRLLDHRIPSRLEAR